MCPINDSEFFFGSVLAHLLIDIAILVLPILQVRQLQLATGQKFAVAGLFMFGTLYGCFAPSPRNRPNSSRPAFVSPPSSC